MKFVEATSELMNVVKMYRHYMPEFDLSKLPTLPTPPGVDQDVFRRLFPEPAPPAASPSAAAAAALLPQPQAPQEPPSVPATGMTGEQFRYQTCYCSIKSIK